MKDYYKILGIDKSASIDDIKKAYRNLAKKHHPDVGGDENLFKEISEAYEVLSNPESKAKYDRPPASDPFNQTFDWGGNDPFSDFFNHPFRDMFGGTRRSQNKMVRANDLIITVELELEEILNPVNKEILFSRNIHCNSCKGSGALNGNEGIENCTNCGGSGYQTQAVNVHGMSFQTQTICSVCGGKGKVVVITCEECQSTGLKNIYENIVVTIPPGVSEGQTLMGLTGINFVKGNCIPGDLLVQIAIKPHEKFKRTGLHIHYDYFIGIADAILGIEELIIPTLDGFVKIKIEPGTEYGKILKLTGKGLPSPTNNSHRGDMLIHINLFIPKKLNNKEKELLKELKLSSNFIVDESKIQGIKGIFTRSQELKSLY